VGVWDCLDEHPNENEQYLCHRTEGWHEWTEELMVVLLMYSLQGV
jgi:hypothetical protein